MHAATDWPMDSVSLRENIRIASDYIIRQMAPLIVTAVAQSKLHLSVCIAIS